MLVYVALGLATRLHSHWSLQYWELPAQNFGLSSRLHWKRVQTVGMGAELDVYIPFTLSEWKDCLCLSINLVGLLQ